MHPRPEVGIELMLLRLKNRVSFSLEFETNAKTFVKDINRALVEYRQHDELNQAPELQIAVPIQGEDRLVWIGANHSEPKIPLLLDSNTIQQVLKTRGVHLWGRIEEAYEEAASFQDWFQSLIEDSPEMDERKRPQLEVVRPYDPEQGDSE
jgi:hypothetical protein